MALQIEGQPTSIETRLQGGSTYVPVLDTAQALGGDVKWDNANKVATVSIGRWTAVVSMAAEDAEVNGAQVTFSGPTLVEHNRMWVPVRFFEAAFGYRIGVSGQDVNIDNPNA